jgi:diguanylate cyclase (GGDEF)-like protein/PAS domain S-box-containing protein
MSVQINSPVTAWYSSPKITKRQLRRRLHEALDAGHIWPAFQPIVDMRLKEVVGFEILARWTDPEFGEIGPATFIPLLEKHQLVDVLSKTLVRSACSAAIDWPGSLYLAFNMSPDQLLSGGLPDWIAALAADIGYPLDRIQIEITEGSLACDSQQAYTTLRKLDALGIRISIDDFGTGYSSLARLEAFPFHTLKIDARFVRGIDQDQAKRRIAAAVIGLGQSLGMSIVAEGVENQAEETILRNLGCPFGQGWLYGRGVPALDAEAMRSRFRRVPVSATSLDASPFQQLHQLRTLYEQAPVGLCFLDLQFRYVRTNEAFAAMHGLSPKELEGRAVDDVLEGALLQRIKALLGPATDRAFPPQDFKRNDRDFRLFAQRVLDVGGDVIGISIVSIDITQQNRLLEHVSRSEEHYRQLIEIGPNIAWGADSLGVVDYMSPAADDPPADTIQNRIERWYATMHPVDRLRVRAEWLHWIPSGMPFRTSFRILWRDGLYRWVESRAHPKVGPDGSVDRWCGMTYELPVDVRPAVSASTASLELIGLDTIDTPIDRGSQTAPDPMSLLFEGISASEAPIAIFAPNDRLVIASSAFRQIYDLQPGEQTFQSIIRHCHAAKRGVLVEAKDIDQWLGMATAKRRSQTHRKFEIDLIDGRWFWALETTFNEGWIIMTMTDMTALKKTEADLRLARDAALHLAETDALTGLRSRRAIMDYFEDCLKTATQTSPVSIAILDIDHFKHINDQFGHDVGDIVLQTFGDHCRRMFRDSDWVGRVGGEEFLLVMPNTTKAAARSALERFRGSVNHTDFTELGGRHVTFSAGFVEHQLGDTVQHTYKNADKALYDAKTSGRDRVMSLDTCQAPGKVLAANNRA